MKGTVKFFDTFKGFGFVKGDDGKEYFVHQSALEPGTALDENDEVEFEPTQGDRGPKAEKVRKAGAGSPEPEASEEEPEEAEESEDEDSEDESEDEDSEEDEDKE